MPVAETRFGRAARIAPESPGAALGADLEKRRRSGAGRDARGGR